jgi:hypothetical protein
MVGMGSVLLKLKTKIRDAMQARKLCGTPLWTEDFEMKISGSDSVTR